MPSNGRRVVLLLMCTAVTDKLFVVRQEHDGLIERWKRKAMDNILELHNKTPVWNDGELH